ncbi:LPS-assembly protein LptD [Aliiroseovarius sp. PTFE2010]|uniref:LPS-assembly protein LptD n=1 Tax=Aliiroseovarius sp. PTFE2010 TaxID=3417190 RepID=UPI003CF267D9
MMRRLFALFLALLPHGAIAQQAASLLADSVRVIGNSAIEARGNVQVFYDGATLSAAGLRYDQTEDRLYLDGPIRLTEPDGAVMIADTAQLDPDLRNGLMLSARLVLNQQLQLAAAEIARVDGRYTQLYKTVASSCQVCASRPVPLWQIRAEKVIHDQQERRLHFENASFELAGQPIIALPRLSLPDPTVDRATGVLVPSIRASTNLSTGLKLPYFIAIGDHADVTLTPYVSARTTTLEARYRQAFRYGDITFEGAASRDDLRPGVTRAYLFGEGNFDLGRDYVLSFAVKLTSDPAYLLDYDYSDEDRLASEIAITRFQRDSQVQARLINIRTLRASEIPTEDQLPFLMGEVIYEQRFQPSIGGEARYRFDLLGYGRASSTDVLGRDGLRIGAELDWTREWQLTRGALFRLTGNLRADTWSIYQDSTYDQVQGAVTPSVAAELRWPLIRTEADHGAVQMLEPLAQLAWTGTAGTSVPNEDSTLVEFDHGNLLSLTRFPGNDRAEDGLRGALGLGWSRFTPDPGWNLSLGAARVIYAENTSGFSPASGLDGLRSDWLLAAHLSMGQDTHLTSRNLVADDFDITKSETRLAWDGERFAIGAVYTYVTEDAAEDRPDTISEMSFDTSYRIDRHWTGTAQGRYDVSTDQAASAGLGLQYRNECIAVELLVSRRFTSSSSLTPETSGSLRVSLAGFGTGPDTEGYRRTCGP